MSAITYVNPVHEESFADPFVWRHGGVYYAVGTGPAEASGAAGSSVFPMLTSIDLVHWRAVGDALLRPDAVLGNTFWAPEVAVRDGVFFLYYSVGRGDRAHQLRVAISDRPEGPYRDHCTTAAWRRRARHRTGSSLRRRRPERRRRVHLLPRMGRRDDRATDVHRPARRLS